MLKRHFPALLAVAVLVSSARVFAAGPEDGATNAPLSATGTPYLTWQEEAKKFVFQEPGYGVELVVGDPVIQDPVLAVFDGNGRMYVAEMRTYMTNLDAVGEFARTSRISLHWSSKGDGNFDRHTVFADNLLLPRMILPLADSVLVVETGSDNIWRYRDTNGDGVADQKELFLAGGARGENLEHQPSGLIWDMDNWIYTTVNAYRLRLKGTNVLREPTAPNYGQWGLTQDDFGKPYFVNAGFEAGPVNFIMPICYGSSEIAGKFTPQFQEVWPLVGTADYEGGLVRVRPGDKTLNHFTGTCGPDVFRGDRLPADLRGDLLFCEPVGRLIRRAKIVVNEGVPTLINPYEAMKSEFIRSTDPYFRPVNLVTAPDGTLYLVDMYRGVIQESAWVGPNSYLRQVVQQNQFEKNFGAGRIWRLVHKDFKPGPQPRLLDEPPEQLVKQLEHPNGWWRDTAQKLLVLRGDPSVVPALAKLARSSPNRLARIQALWTLEGLDALDPELVREKLADRDPQVRMAAMRVSETLYQAGDQSLVPDIQEQLKDPDPAVVLQVLMTATRSRWPNSRALVADTMATNHAGAIQRLGPTLIQNAAPVVYASEFTPEEKDQLARGREIYRQLCFACHGVDGRGAPLTGPTPGTTTNLILAPSLHGSKLVTGYGDGVINLVMKGLMGPVDGKTYAAQMVPMQANDDAWLAAVISYIRNDFDNSAGFITTNDVARVRATFAGRVTPWTLPELNAMLPKPLPDRRRWQVTASQNPKNAPLAIDGNPRTRYDTRAAQTPGMWFQIKLPSETAVAGIELDAGTSTQDFPRGYQVELSDDGKKWSEPVGTGHGTGAQTEILFPPAKARYLRITLTAPAPGHYWSIHEMQVLKPAPPPVATVTKKAPKSISE